jgi:NAD(P)-dependent dehydrogenase (short-subunit alcohol dehydrogenase family)
MELFAKEVMPELKEREDERVKKKDEELAPFIAAALARKPRMAELTGAFLCTREAVKLMSGAKDRGGGVVLNLGSINTFLPFAPRHADGASKAAIDILTRCMAAELGPAGIRTATIAPGYIRTPGVAGLKASGKIDVNAIKRRIPLGDMGAPHDVAEAAFFLASADASYINGSILYVDGGWTSFGNAGNASEIADEESDLRGAAE